ncbi:hypothetical protein GCM10022420_089170 [Streptomyces iranensis]
MGGREVTGVPQRAVRNGHARRRGPRDEGGHRRALGHRTRAADGRHTAEDVAAGRFRVLQASSSDLG